MAAETGFIIDGTRYEVPTLDTFTMDEAQVLYDYSGLGIEDFVPIAEPPAPPDNADQDAKAAYDELLAARDGELEALNRKLRNPGFLRALVHVAYQRGNPKFTPQRVREAVGASDHTQNWVAFIEEGLGDETVPPALTTEQTPSSPRSSVVSNESSGTPSTKPSDGQGDQPEPITTGVSDTSLASALTSSAG